MDQSADSQRPDGEFLRSHAHCFTCGPGNIHGLHLDFKLGEGAASADWHPGPEHQSYSDRVHGGILTTLMDSAMVYALLTNDIHGVTAEMHTRFRHPAVLDAPVTVKGYHLSSKRGIHYCRAEIIQQEKTIVHCTAKFLSITNP